MLGQRTKPAGSHSVAVKTCIITIACPFVTLISLS